jgi:hypothetical protein
MLKKLFQNSLSLRSKSTILDLFKSSSNLELTPSTLSVLVMIKKFWPGDSLLSLADNQKKLFKIGPVLVTCPNNLEQTTIKIISQEKKKKVNKKIMK